MFTVQLPLVIAHGGLFRFQLFFGHFKRPAFADPLEAGPAPGNFGIDIKANAPYRCGMIIPQKLRGLGTVFVSMALGAGLCLMVCVQAIAQETSAPLQTWDVYQRFQGSSSSFGHIVRANTNLSSRINSVLTLDLGAPYYLVSYASGNNGSSVVKNGFGNVYADIRLSPFTGPIRYVSTLTVTAPTGKTANGFGTGHWTTDWNNGVEHVFAQRVSVYGNAGVANTISDTPLYLQPFSSQGVVGHFDVGTNLSLSRRAYVGVSTYATVPTGQQTIISKVIETHVETTTQQVPRGNSGKMKTVTSTRVFETVSEVKSSIDLATDRGLSTWIGVGPLKNIDFTLGYNHSSTYSRHTFFYGLGIQLGRFGRKAQ
jgi:hypothetical protein